MIRPEIKTHPDAFPDALSVQTRKPLEDKGFRVIRSVQNHFRTRYLKTERVRKRKTRPDYFPDVLSLCASRLCADTSRRVRKCNLGKRIYPENTPYLNRGISGRILGADGLRAGKGK
jgi:hypothetical protein